jgi:hypothetical protein
MTGLILALQNRPGEARACYQWALSLDPGFTPAREALDQSAAKGSESAPAPPAH